MRRLVPSFALSLCLVSALCVGEVVAQESSDELIRQVADAYQCGEFERAWRAYQEYYRQPPEDDYHLADCIVAHEGNCPSIAQAGC